MRTLGIDVSHYQGEVPWLQVATSQVKFAYAKATEGSAWLDNQFAKNWPRMQEAGLFRGAYHFARPGQDPETQAVHFASVVGALGFRDLPPMLDLEADDKQSISAVLAWTKAFLTKAEALFGRQLVVYTGGFWRNKLEDPIDAIIGQRKLWLADYRATPQNLKNWKDWTFWQFTEGSHNGPITIPGLAACDQDWFAGDEAALNALCQGDPAVSTSTPPASASAPATVDDIPPGGTYFVWPHTPAIKADAVGQWQTRMVALGFAVDVDNTYGPQSKTACLAFQRTHGLPANGIVDSATWAATFSEDQSLPVLRRVTNSELTPALEAQAVSILQAHYGEPFGTQYPFDLGGTHYYGRLEQHYHPPGGPEKPWGYHTGVSLFVQTNA